MTEKLYTILTIIGWVILTIMSIFLLLVTKMYFIFSIMTITAIIESIYCTRIYFEEIADLD